MANYIKGTKIQENSISETKLDSSLQSWKGTITNHINNISNPHNTTKSDVGLGNVTNDAQVKRSELGVANGVATLDSTGKVPSGQLPSYVDDVIEGYLYNGVFYKDTSYTTSIVGESGKIYIDLPTNKTYRWTGSVYGVISETIALGETPSTAYRGDRGKIAYDHSQSAHAPSNAQANVIETIKVNGTALTPNSKAVDITIPTVGNGTITIKQGGTSKGTFTTNQNGNTTIELTDTNTTYTAGDGLSLSGTTFNNNGVRSIATGTTNGTISVNTNGNISNIGVYGLKSAAYTNSSDYATASHTHSYLPLSGGTIESTSGYMLTLNRISESPTLIAFQSRGVLKGFLGITNAGAPVYLNENAKTSPLLHSGNYNSYALPLSGGTLSGSIRTLLTLQSSNSMGPIIDLKSQSGDSVSNLGHIPSNTNYGTYLSNIEGQIGLLLSNDGVAYLTTNTNYLTKNYTILHSGNYNSYAPTLTGTGASGTWGISISGNADTLDGFHASSLSKTKVIDLQTGQVLRLGINRGGYLVNIQGNMAARNAVYYIGGYGTGTTARNHIRVIKDGSYEVYTNGSSEHSCFYIRSTIDSSFDSITIIALTGDNISTEILSEVPSDAVLVNNNMANILATKNDNVYSATQLQTSRTIWGQSFDGTGNVSGALTGVTSITASGHTKVNSLKTQSICIECDNSGNTDGRTSEINNYSGNLYLQHDTSNNCFICTGGGNVGIGTNTPSYKLHVVGDGYFTENVITESDFSSRGNAIIDGRVGIGTSSPAYNLDVDGNMRITGPIRLNVPNSNEKYYISTEYNGLLGITYEGRYQNPAFLMNNLGYVYLNCENPLSPAYPLVVNGTIECTKLLQTSDIKYKTNIKQIEYEEALKIIENLNPVTWDWNENTVETGSSSGFVAQEAEEFIPNAISRDNENNLSLDYTQLHSYEIRVIQEQQKEIKDLKQRLEVLESLVLQLTNREI